MKLLEQFNFGKFRVSIWPTLWAVFFFFCLIVWGLHLGQQAERVLYPLRLVGYVQSIIPWIIGAAIFFNPKLGLVFLVFAISLSPIQIFGRLTESRLIEIRMEDYLIPFLYFIWLSRMWIKRKMKFIKVPITAPIVALVLALTFSTLIGTLVNWTEPVPAFFYWLKMLEYYALFYLIVNLVETEEERYLLIYSLIFVSVIVSIWAIFQGITGFVISTGRAGGRAAMPFDTEPATLGEYYILLIPLLLVTLFPRKNVRQLLFNGLIVVAAFLGLLFSLSRGSQVGLFLALPLFSFIFVKETRVAIGVGVLLLLLYVFLAEPLMNIPTTFTEFALATQISIIFLFSAAVILAFIFIKRHRLLIAVLTLASMIFFLNPKFIQRLGSLTGELTSMDTVATYDEGGVVQVTRSGAEAGLEAEEVEYHSWANRVSDLWPQAIEKISQNPVFGKGLTSLKVADNYFLRITAEAGVIGLFCFLWLIVRMYKNIFKALKRAPAEGSFRLLALAGLIILSAVLISCFSDDTFVPVKIMEPFWLIMGLFYSAYARFNWEETGTNV